MFVSSSRFPALIPILNSCVRRCRHWAVVTADDSRTKEFSSSQIRWLQVNSRSSFCRSIYSSEYSNPNSYHRSKHLRPITWPSPRIDWPLKLVRPRIVRQLRLKTHGVENRRRFSNACVFSLIYDFGFIRSSCSCTLSRNVRNKKSVLEIKDGDNIATSMEKPHSAPGKTVESKVEDTYAMHHYDKWANGQTVGLYCQIKTTCRQRCTHEPSYMVNWTNSDTFKQKLTGFIFKNFFAPLL